MVGLYNDPSGESIFTSQSQADNQPTALPASNQKDLVDRLRKRIVELEKTQCNHQVCRVTTGSVNMVW